MTPGAGRRQEDQRHFEAFEDFTLDDLKPENEAAALPEADAGGARLVAERPDHDLVAVLKKPPLGAVRKLQGILSAPGALRRTAARVLGGPGVRGFAQWQTG
jgi:hypothetical protein